MASIGKQSVSSSILIYIGFLVGAVNTLTFTNKAFFTPDQYGFTRIMFDIGLTLFALANLGSIAILNKFYPYYRDRLPAKERDLFGKMTIMAIIGFIVVAVIFYFSRGIILRKTIANSPMVMEYFYLFYPFTFFLLLFSLLEAQAWNLHASVATTFLKELVLRLLTSLIVGLFILKLLNYDQFILLFSLLYGIITVALFVYLRKKYDLTFTIKTSYVTQKMATKMVPYATFVTAISCFSILGRTLDTLFIMSKDTSGLANVGVFSYITYLTALMEAPQRSIIAASLPVIAQAWKDKDLGRISRIYKKSAINMLLFAGFMYGLIALSFADSITLLSQDPAYAQGYVVFLILGFTKVMEVGTGVNSQIILTSRYWRMDLVTTVALVVVLIPLNYFLINAYGLTGVALATLIAYSIFNIARFVFIWVKFGMQPFTMATLYALGLFVVNYYIASWIFSDNPLLQTFLRSGVFTLLSAVMIIKLNVSEDVNKGYGMILARATKLLGRKG
ncbi:lipopolysaccharide biosynthesis protein [uncultured Chitinophaga sp.]|uniref:lipopolysaccharide biosynthesis protein n=1 Tax=uncultured Chitinophaga sp. TaxID=339340 RepID=UPI0025F7FEE6|nr:polysaccharide biosynthesis C-terminal domain-containing protein [uncultured Chitinophaga sp.]